MLIGKKPISFEIFCLKKYSHGKVSKKLTQIYKMNKNYNSFFAEFSRGLSRDVFMDEIEQID